jgi:hypothetical protein
MRRSDGSSNGANRRQLRNAARHFAENGGGVLLYLDQEGRGNGLGNKILAYDLQAHGFDTYDADEALGFEQDGRRFEFAAAMLEALGAQPARLLTKNPEKIAALGAAGLEVVADQRVMGRRNAHNERYLAAKRDKAGAGKGRRRKRALIIPIDIIYNYPMQHAAAEPAEMGAAGESAPRPNPDISSAAPQRSEPRRRASRRKHRTYE